MKLTFIFTDTPDLKTLRPDEIYQVNFEFPEAAAQLEGFTAKVLEIGQLVAQLTDGVLHLTCKEADLLKHPLKVTKEARGSIRHEMNVALLRFDGTGRRPSRKAIKILLPSDAASTALYLHKRMENLYPQDYEGYTPEQKEWAVVFKRLAERYLELLNSDSQMDGYPWRFRGFNPRCWDNTLVKRYNHSGKKRAAEERQRERLAKKQEAQIAKSTNDEVPIPIPKTGAGRRIGAVPGIFKGIQFRSQLEIRFATELESRGIVWVYESERLGDGSYLVDFYLPGLKCWVEVKGRLEPRDDYLLREVSALLKNTRSEKLFVYTQSKAYVVNPSGFREMTHDEFWKKL